jgi:hypothetical protein
MNDEMDVLVAEIREIRKLLELLAEPAIAARDAKFRDALRKIVGGSLKKQRAVFLMDGNQTQKEIVASTSVHQGELSTMVGRLHEADLLTGDKKFPKLAIGIPPNFFDAHAGER